MNVDMASVLAEMQAGFLDELPERCNRVETQVLDLERGVSGALDELYRLVHSLKGAGGTFGLPLVSTICHQFENWIGETSGHGDQRQASIGLRYVDLLRRFAAREGRTDAAIAQLEDDLERLRQQSTQGRSSVLLVEPSEVTRKLYQGVFASKNIRVLAVSRGLEALESLLHEPVDLLVTSRELPDLNALAVVAALREARVRNSDIPAILVSSSQAPVPDYLRIDARLARDPKLVANLVKEVEHLLNTRKALPTRPA